MLSTDRVSVSPPSTELLTLVSQKLCVVVYPEAEGTSGTKEINEDVEEQRQPIYQDTLSKDKDSVEQPQP